MPRYSHIVRSTLRLFLLAFGLASVMAIQLAVGNGMLKALGDGTLPWQAMIMTVVMVVIAVFTVVNAFTATMRPESHRLAGTLASCALALLAGLEANHVAFELPIHPYFALSLLGHCAF